MDGSTEDQGDVNLDPEDGDRHEPSDDGHGMDLGYLEEMAELAVFNCLAVDSRAFRRERKKAYRRVISELYSPPRVTEMLSALPNAALVPGYALDLTVADPTDGEPWDFSRKAKQERERRLLDHQKPMLVVLSPECKAFSTWNQLNRFKHGPGVAERLEKERAAAMEHLRFTVTVMHDQLAAGRYFLFEHHVAASSWRENASAPSWRFLMSSGLSRTNANLGRRSLMDHTKGARFARQRRS